MVTRRLAFVALLGAVAFGPAACGGGNGVTTTEQPGEILFDLSANGASGVRARLTYETDHRTRITVDGLDEGESAGGGANPVRLRNGSCEEPGTVVATLPPLKGSVSESVAEIGLSELLSGKYAIEVSLPGENSDETATAACGDIPENVSQ
jgi:hypothetical protein